MAEPSEELPVLLNSHRSTSGARLPPPPQGAFSQYVMMTVMIHDYDPHPRASPPTAPCQGTATGASPLRCRVAPPRGRFRNGH